MSRGACWGPDSASDAVPENGYETRRQAARAARLDHARISRDVHREPRAERPDAALMPDRALQRPERGEPTRPESTPARAPRKARAHAPSTRSPARAAAGRAHAGRPRA